jgi:hypothetical protein
MSEIYTWGTNNNGTVPLVHRALELYNNTSLDAVSIWDGTTDHVIWPDGRVNDPAYVIGISTPQRTPDYGDITTYRDPLNVSLGIKSVYKAPDWYGFQKTGVYITPGGADNFAEPVGYLGGIGTNIFALDFTMMYHTQVPQGGSSNKDWTFTLQDYNSWNPDNSPTEIGYSISSVPDSWHPGVDDFDCEDVMWREYQNRYWYWRLNNVVYADPASAIPLGSITGTIDSVGSYVYFDDNGTPSSDWPLIGCSIATAFRMSVATTTSTAGGPIGTVSIAFRRTGLNTSWKSEAAKGQIICTLTRDTYAPGAEVRLNHGITDCETSSGRAYGFFIPPGLLASSTAGDQDSQTLIPGEQLTFNIYIRPITY